MDSILSLNLTIPKERIAKFCRANKISRLAIFGSALREDFGPDSDIDILVSFESTARHNLYDMKTRLEEIFGLRKVATTFVAKLFWNQRNQFMNREESTLDLLYKTAGSSYNIHAHLTL